VGFNTARGDSLKVVQANFQHPGGGSTGGALLPTDAFITSRAQYFAMAALALVLLVVGPARG